MTTYSLPLCRLVIELSSHNIHRSLYMRLRGQEKNAHILDVQREMTMPYEGLREREWLGGGLILARTKKLAVHCRHAGIVVIYLNTSEIMG
jgi:hypothetical protein